MQKIIAACLILITVSISAHAASKRIEVYALGQQYWDIKPGDTLGQITQQLLPNNPGLRKKLIQDIIRLNPKAFVNNNANLLRSGSRLWLPGYFNRPDTKVDPRKYKVESYSWGNIKRPIR